MNWLEINGWLERYAGVSYDITTMVEDCRGTVVIQDPYVWYIDMHEMVMHYNSIVEIIEGKSSEIPSSLKSKKELEDVITSHFKRNLISIIEDVKDLLNMPETRMSSMNDIAEQVTVIYEIVNLVTNNEIDNFTNEFEELNEKFNGRITDDYRIHSSDLLTMSAKIDSIINQEISE